MDNRLFYVAGDLIANLAIGIIVALVASWIVGPAWNMWAAMFAMMVLGMVLGLVLYFPIGSRFGAMEVMIPAMYTGMWSGMVIGMIDAMMDLSWRHAAEIGAACGAAEIVFIWIANTILRGITRQPGKAV